MPHPPTVRVKLRQEAGPPDWRIRAGRGTGAPLLGRAASASVARRTENPTNEVFVSAHQGDTDIVAVVVNRSSSSQSLSFSVPGVDVSSFEQVTTSSSKNLSDDGSIAASSGSFSVTVDGQSVTTLRGSRAGSGTGARSFAWPTRRTSATTRENASVPMISGPRS